MTLHARLRDDGLEYGLFERAQEAWAWFRQRVPAGRRVRVIGDDDSDGVDSAHVLSTALQRAGYQVDVVAKALHAPGDLDGLFGDRFDAYLVADCGSSLLRELDAFGAPIVVLDHHTVGSYAPKFVFEVNPRRQGGDKVRHVSASVVSLLFALEMSDQNWDLAYAALSGAVSDRQHLGGLDGLVAYCIEGGERAGVLRRRTGLTLVGPTLQSAIADSLDPYFADYTGNPQATDTFLRGLGVDPEASPLSLKDEAARRVADALSASLHSRGVVLERMYPLYGEQLLLQHPSGVSTILELAQLMEAATASHAESAALDLLAGNPKARQRLDKLKRERLGRILAEIQRIRPTVQEGKHLRWAETRDDANTGVYAHTLLTFIHGDDKPFLVVSRRGAEAKMSARGSPRLYGAGVDLSIGMSRAAQEVGGHGGGHPGAAGATVAWVQRAQFLERLDETLGMLRRGPSA